MKKWSDLQRGLANAIYDCGAIKFGTFGLKFHEKLPDAPLSPIYIDLRVLRSYPDKMEWAVTMLEEMSRELQFDYYADVSTAVTPIVAVLSYVTRTPMITLREPKTYGAIESIDGIFRFGQTVLLIDDLITRANSKLEAIKVLEKNGLEVCDVLVLLDHEQGGAEQLKEKGYALHAAFKLSQLLQYYVWIENIAQAKYDEVMAYIAADK